MKQNFFLNSLYCMSMLHFHGTKHDVIFVYDDRLCGRKEFTWHYEKKERKGFIHKPLWYYNSFR